MLDPCASAELTRGCPWDCSFCSAWTFYGRSYRKSSPVKAAEDLASIREPNVFLVDDVAFIHAEHGFAIGEELERRKVKKQYYLETRCDVLIKNRDLFKYWKKLGLFYMFLGLEALDEEALKLHRKRVTPGRISRRWRSRGSSGWWSPSTSSPTATGTSVASRSSANGP